MAGEVRSAVREKVFTSALSRGKDWKLALRSVTAQVKHELDGKTCDLAFLFVSEPYPDLDPEALTRLFKEQLPSGLLMSCNASGVIGEHHEVEREPGMSLLGIHAPDVQSFPFVLSKTDIEGLQSGADLIQWLDVYPTDKPHFLCLADPAHGDIQGFLDVLNEGYGGCPVVGGGASAGAVGLPNWLVVNDRVCREGVVGAALTGEISFEVAVSQACRPIGKRFVITKADRRIVFELAGRPALDVLREVLEKGPPGDRQFAQKALLVGLVMNEQQIAFKRGDFLIRNLVGVDPASRSLMISAPIRVGQTLQFQLRDALVSADELKSALQKKPGTQEKPSQGALFVNCCGRGRGLYGRPDHDVQMIQSLRGPVPLGGFFANGEFGYVGGKNYLHEYTASLTFIR